MSVPPSDLTLDDVATLLLQLEPEDRDDWRAPASSSPTSRSATRSASAVQPLVARAVKALKPLADGTAADPAAAYAEVCALVERAMDATAGAPAPAAKPAPAAPAAAAAPAAPADDRLPTDLDLELLATSSSRAASASSAARPRCSSSSARPTTSRR
jgi:hypothetical protein